MLGTTAYVHIVPSRPDSGAIPTDFTQPPSADQKLFLHIQLAPRSRGQPVTRQLPLHGGHGHRLVCMSGTGLSRCIRRAAA